MKILEQLMERGPDRNDRALNPSFSPYYVQITKANETRLCFNLLVGSCLLQKQSSEIDCRAEIASSDSRKGIPVERSSSYGISWIQNRSETDQSYVAKYCSRRNYNGWNHSPTEYNF